MVAKKVVRAPRPKHLYHTVLRDGTVMAFLAANDAAARRKQGRIAKQLNA